MNELLTPRLDFLRAAQNADGGWGFFPGKQSWLEPTAYALVALHSSGSGGEHFERGWKLMRSWQLPSGSWKPCAAVDEPHWTTSLAVTLHALRGVRDQQFERGVEWLLGTWGSENSLKFRVVHMLRPSVVELDPSFKAWPWLPGNSSWIEPTAHALVALKQALRGGARAQLQERIHMGESMILERRCSDGGWNYGNRKVLGTELPSYPETTALALLGLAGNPSLDLAGPIGIAKSYLAKTRSPLAKAWLKVSLRSHGVSSPPDGAEPLAANDVIIQALEIMATTGVLA